MPADLFTHGTLQCCSAGEGAVRALLRWISQGINADQMRLQFQPYWDHFNYALQVCVLINMINAQCIYALGLIQRQLYPCLPAQGMQWVQADCH
jgi:hypothetical protein